MGRYIVPPIVLDGDGVPVGELNAEVLATIVEAGKGVTLPVIFGARTRSP